MQQSLNKEKLKELKYHVGNEEILLKMPQAPVKALFSPEVTDFLQSVSRMILSDRRSRAYPDVITFGFWIRKANIAKLQKEYEDRQQGRVIGRGMVFHIAPSNVPVNYAYSLVTGLICGNANVVKIPSKDFEQIDIINEAFLEALKEYPQMAPYLVLVRYGHQSEINDALSEYADARVIWGGDQTIEAIRRSPVHSRAVEVAFADRYSLAVIDADYYLSLEDKEAVARDFYNDTYLTDQNACSSPRAVIWTGEKIADAKETFWGELRSLLEGKYEIQPVQVVNKLTSSYLLAAEYKGVKRIAVPDNYIVRMHVESLDDHMMDLKDNSGYFFEYDCGDFSELKDVCNNVHCQTLAYIGNKEALEPLLQMNVKGIDRIVPVGKTMDFEFLWDGYDLVSQLTRTIRVR